MQSSPSSPHQEGNAIERRGVEKKIVLFLYYSKSNTLHNVVPGVPLEAKTLSRGQRITKAD